MEERLRIEERLRKLIGETQPIDYNNTQKLVEDIWLFLTNDNRPAKASIKKEALLHEASCMIDSVREFCSRERSIAFAEWMLKNKAQSFGFEIKWSINGSDHLYSTFELYSKFLESIHSEHSIQNE